MFYGDDFIDTSEVIDPEIPEKSSKATLTVNKKLLKQLENTPVNEILSQAIVKAAL
jgi:hypothetical protein